MAPQRQPTLTRPKEYKLSWKALLTLPFRLCNPPPAVGKVRSCGVTPAFNVRLEDVLDRKHLPPLGLKDFEEWLLYVELAPENLYFILWLKEYTVKYRQWEAASRLRRSETPAYLGVWPRHNSSQLTMFYARAKQTFLTPNANHELNLPSDVLAPFHTSNGSPHPDPAVFNQVAVQVQKMLKESLERFVTAQFNNVGNSRVLCGLIAGIFCCLVGAVFPMVYNIVKGHSRWLRLTALPGLWLGLALLLTSLNGVCLAIYVFGDLRQLRRFELSRPPISKPQPLYSSRRRPMVASPISTATPSPPVLTPPPMAHIDSSRPNSLVTISSSICYDHSHSMTDLSSEGSDMIRISPAYYDADPIEGPATAPVSIHRPGSGFSDDEDSSGDETYSSTALFIHPFDGSTEDISDYEFPSPNKLLPEELQRISEFNFDTLPRPISVTKHAHTDSVRPLQPDVLFIEPETPAPDLGKSPKAFIRRIQSKCSINKWMVIIGGTPEEDSAPSLPTSSDEKLPVHDTVVKPKVEMRAKKTDESIIRKQYKKVKAVPAFASPLTRVLSPVVIRGQWEIVIRSFVIACLVSWLIVGSLLAVPEFS
ncbi:uncharacterized protein BT62DRAFT_982231 [Guyanagaster necrorhizus]|uniref:Transmembrane protein n=1 Tax=Guyanagaster necrorhizus TaxID=856835 RepID=A0A9P7VNF8_9AGAR|nr:uncharacterized protein BT62DRAFT_982231 [Guyanagaster necrorhizus MCA 3950]KAG7443069.1 hypothetical protein BT62DRAFT_982231 [Guyanagaster necrorhizus MCA 3950]